MNTKQIAFATIMSALGITLSVISLNVAPLLPASAQGGAALDLSHIATFVSAFFGGPLVGAIVGLISGIYAGYYFGFVLGSLGLLSVIGVPTGKALTGLLAGFLYKKSGLNRGSLRSAWAFPLTLLSYVPESLYTILYFLYVVTVVNGQAMAYMIPIVIPKAWVEIVVMSLFMGALAGNTGFREFINRSVYQKGRGESSTGRA